MKDLLLILLVQKKHIRTERKFVNLILLIISAFVFYSGCCSNEVLKRYTITVDCETIAGRGHNEFQADSCFRIGSKFIAFSNKDSVVYNINEFCGTINVKCNREYYKDQLTEDEFLSTRKK